MKNAGYTLVEILTGIAIMAILTGLALPAFTTLWQNDRSISITNNLMTVLNLARSEAIDRGMNVTVCPASDANFTSCGTDWTQGWIVLQDPNNNQSVSSSTLIRTESFNNVGLSITTNPSVNLITFTSSGFPAATSANVTFSILTSGCSADYGRNIAINFTGQFNVTHVNCP